MKIFMLELVIRKKKKKKKKNCKYALFQHPCEMLIIWLKFCKLDYFILFWHINKDC